MTRDFLTAPMDERGYIDFGAQDMAQEVAAALRAGFMTCCTGPNMPPQVRVEFSSLHDAQKLHRALVVLVAQLSK